MSEETLYEHLKNIDSKTTLIWDKLDKVETDVMAIKIRLASMPCDVHKEKMLGFAQHIENGKIWRTGIIGLALAFGALAVRWGETLQTTANNEKALDALEYCCDNKRAVEKDL